MAGTAVIPERPARFLIQRPMAAVLVALAVLGVASLGLSTLTGGSPARAPSHGRTSQPVAPYALPTPEVILDESESQPAHRALHALGRACQPKVAERTRNSVLRPLRVIERFASRYPAGGFTIDDESGTTLSLLIVVRNELETCDPGLVPRVDELIPGRYRTQESRSTSEVR